MNIDNLISSMAPMATTWAMRVLGVIVVMVIAFKIGSWARASVKRSLDNANFDPTLGSFLSGMARWGVLLVAILACLGLFGIETTSVAAVLGAAGLAVGLAFQGSLSNFAAGVMLLVFRPFQLGDVISVAGQTGGVKEIGLFTISMDTPDNRRIILPNSAVFGAAIENITAHDVRRVDVTVGAAYDADIDATRACLQAAASAVQGRREDMDVQIYLMELGGSSVDWQVRVWCDTGDWFDVREATVRAIKNAMDEANIGIPYPTMDLHVDGRLANLGSVRAAA